MHPIFVQITAGKDASFFKPPLVEYPSHATCMHPQVAAVQPDATHLDAILRKFAGQGDDLGGSRLGVVGIDQQRRVFRMATYEMFESGSLVCMGLNVGMSNGAE